MSKWYCRCWRCWNWSWGWGGGPVGWVAAGSLRPCVAWLVVGPSGWTAVWRWEFAGQLAVVECGWVGLALGLALVAAICLQGGPLVPPGGLPGRCGVKFPALLLVYTPWVRSSGLMPTASECALLVDASLVHRFPPVWVVTSCRTANAWRSCCHGTDGASRKCCTWC